MHWGWRAVTTTAFGCVFSLVSALLFDQGRKTILYGVEFFGEALPFELWTRQGSHQVAIWCFWVGPIVVVTAAFYGILTHYTRLFDHETRCRKCSYILRGLTEPRCPECGEGI